MPTGELPRSVSLLVDRHLVGKVAPGTRVVALGIHTTHLVSFDLGIHAWQRPSFTATVAV